MSALAAFGYTVIFMELGIKPPKNKNKNIYLEYTAHAMTTFGIRGILAVFWAWYFSKDPGFAVDIGRIEIWLIDK